MEEMNQIKRIDGLTEEQVDEIKQAFLLFGDDSGEIDLEEFKEAIQSLKLYLKYPIVYKLILNINTKNNKNTLTFDEFIQQIGESLGKEYTKEGIRKIFDLFNSNQGQSTIKIRDLIQKCGELRIKLPDHIFNFILNNIKDKDKETLTFEEFYLIMTKNVENNKSKEIKE